MQLHLTCARFTKEEEVTAGPRGSGIPNRPSEARLPAVSPQWGLACRAPSPDGRGFLCPGEAGRGCCGGGASAPPLGEQQRPLICDYVDVRSPRFPDICLEKISLNKKCPRWPC